MFLRMIAGLRVQDEQGQQGESSELPKSRNFSRDWRLYQRLLALARPYRLAFNGALLGMLVYAATEPLVPALIKLSIEQVFLGVLSPLVLWGLPLTLLLVFTVRGIASFAGNYGVSWVAQKVMAGLRSAVYARMLRLPCSVIESEGSGALVSRLVTECSTVANAMAFSWMTVVRCILISLTLFAWIAYISWRLTLISLIMLPIVGWMTLLNSRRLRRLSTDSVSSHNQLMQIAKESVYADRVIKIFEGYRRQTERFNATAEFLRVAETRMAAAAAMSGPLVYLFISTILGIVLVVAMFESVSGRLTVSSFISFMVGLILMLEPLRQLAVVNQSIQRALAGAESIFSLIDQAEEKDVGDISILRARGQVVFEKVSFRYPEAPYGLVDIQLEIEAGEMVAVVGASGAGKTTLMNLLPRFIEPDAGRILLDGIPLSNIRLADLRRQMSLVSQNTILFHDTIRENIIFGCTEPVDDHRVWEALEAAMLSDYVRCLPKALDTVIGEYGMRLSGGQRQRLALARVFLRDAPILLLDEATSALDTNTERAIQDSFRRVAQNRTTLIIAHRLSSLEGVGRIIVLDQGRIVEQGTHASLMALEGLYFSLHKSAVFS